MLQKRYQISLIMSLLYMTLGYTVEYFSSLKALKNVSSNMMNPPIVALNPNGKYAIVWEELGEVPETVGIRPRSYYYQLFNSEGEKITGIEEFDEWKVPANNFTHSIVRFTPHTILWVNSDNLLVVGRLGYYYHLERSEGIIINNKSGRIIKKGTFNIKNEILGSSLKLVKAKNGDVYLVETGTGYDWRAHIMQVFPHIGKLSKVSAQNDILKWLITEDNAVTITSNNKFLFCYRLKTSGNMPVWEAPEGWSGMPNDLVYFLTDLEGNLIISPQLIDLTKDAFRKMPGIHLGGNYGKGASDDMDLSKLPNGDIILSVTGLDEKGHLSVYQVKFSAEGNLIRADSLVETEPKKYPQDRILPVSKVLPSIIGLGEIPDRNKVLVRRELVLFGFDEEGKFYEERIVWKEGEE